MKRFNFHSHPFLDSLYIEFKSTTEYIHSIRKVKDKDSKRVEPYEPSMFIFSYFAFNSLYNIDWEKTALGGCEKAITNDMKKETDRINYYLDFIWNKNRQNEIAFEFNRTIRHVIKQYLSEKGIDTTNLDVAEWIQANMLDFILSSNENNAKENTFEDDEIDNFEGYIIKSLDEQKLNISEIKHILKIIYLIRCNLFHGAKDPEFFEQNHQMERFVIYAAILTAINQLLFSTMSKLPSRCAH